LSNFIKPNAFGLGSTKKIVSFIKNSSHTGISRYTTDGEENKLNSSENLTELKVESFDYLIKDRKIDVSDIGLIKIDVEGFEHSTLKGMERTLDNLKDGVILIIEIWENHPKKDRTLKFLKNKGFKLQQKKNANYLLEKSH
jgi:FkbM family methyltransferase